MCAYLGDLLSRFCELYDGLSDLPLVMGLV